MFYYHCWPNNNNDAISIFFIFFHKERQRSVNSERGGGGSERNKHRTPISETHSVPIEMTILPLLASDNNARNKQQQENVSLFFCYFCSSPKKTN